MVSCPPFRYVRIELLNLFLPNPDGFPHNGKTAIDLLQAIMERSGNADGNFSL